MHSSATVHAAHTFRDSKGSRVRRSLTTICVEIKPSRQQEEPYLLCKGANQPEYEQPHPLTNAARSNFQNNFNPNMMFVPDFQQIKNNHVSQELFPRYLQNFQQHQSTLDSAKHNLPYVNPTVNNEHPQLNGHKPAVTTTFLPLYGGSINGNQHKNLQRVNAPPFVAPNFDNSNEFNSRISTAQQQTFQPAFNTNMPPIIIPTATPAVPMALIPDNQVQELKEPTVELSRRNVLANTFTLPTAEVSSQESTYAQPPSPTSKLHALPYADDPVMQQFYSIQREPSMVTSTHREDLFGVPNVHRYIETLPPASNHAGHMNIPRSCTVENQCNNFQNEAISVSVAPTYNYCNTLPSVPAYTTFPPIIIALPAYNAMPAAVTTGASPPYYRPFSTTNTNPSHENFIRDNMCTYLPQPTEMVGLPIQPFINNLQRSLFPNFNMMPRLTAGLLGSARKMLPVFHNTPNAFRPTEPITGISNPNTLLNAPQSMPMESTSSMNNLNLAQTKGLEHNGAAHWSNVQSTTVPMPTDIVEPSVIVASSQEDSSTPQHDEKESSATPSSLAAPQTDPTSDLKTISPTEASETSAESTKKILTIIEKARRLQMRHKIEE
ncbi:unnamed protein product [Ceratitis capitata]|uniref:(Mediterranean fruit fly) hypothetical protein n=1 Tax=Ceratitis capitata TaxID=7213 RepID=A0A811UGD5_CERCA|nr:unnamed protein product [Ceratitis capitata]